MKPKKPLIALVLTALALGAIWFVVKKKGVEVGNNETCPITKEEKLVQGNSLSGIVENGEKVKVQMGYYACNEPERGDLVVYKYAGNPQPIIKIVKGIPGDTFEVKEEGKGNSVLINGEALKTSKGEPFTIPDASLKLLRLYETDYKGIIPKDTYFIMGNIPEGSEDSTRFGFVSNQDFLGRAER